MFGNRFLVLFGNRTILKCTFYIRREILVKEKYKLNIIYVDVKG